MKLNKETKIKLLEAIQTGEFNGELFPELKTELDKITIEIINSCEQVDHEL
jgi:hypothetical protein